jgi:hypothetical protein
MSHYIRILAIALMHLPFTASAIIEITSFKPITPGNGCDGEINITASGLAGTAITPPALSSYIPS